MRMSEDFTTVINEPGFNKVDLGGGFYMEDNDEYDYDGDVVVSNLWKDGEYVGNLSTKYNIFKPYIHVAIHVGIMGKWRGKGLGERAVRAFVRLHGPLASPIDGNISDDAIRMFERMGAEKVKTKNPHNRMGYYYILRK